MPKPRVFVAARAEVVRSNRSRSAVIDRPEVRVRAVERADVPDLTLRCPDHGVIGATDATVLKPTTSPLLFTPWANASSPPRVPRSRMPPAAVQRKARVWPDERLTSPTTTP